jgi:hypothetical protein
MSLRATRYQELQNADVRGAFRSAYDEIKEHQDALRRVDPENPLIKLILLNEDGQGLSFARNFRGIVMEHSDIGSNTGLYYAIGLYIDLLEREVETPLFGKR